LLDVVSHINEALEKGRFRLYFQEICPQGNNSTRYWEVLVRMFNGPGDFLLPGAFLPSAERFGLVKQIDLWVLENSIKMLSDMCQSTGCDFPSVSINVSGATVMSREYIKTLKRLLTDYSVDPSKLCLELTETVAVSNLTRAKAFIDQLREIGCCFALDDFGMGMSSLAYLKELPMDYLKIDASFVKDIAEDEVNAAIVSSVKQVSDVLGLKTIAEGVESEDQAEHLREVGIDYLQGFLLRRPVPFEEFSSLVVDRNPVV